MLGPREKLPLFVYGSLSEGFYNHDIYLKGKVLTKHEAKTKGKLFHLENKGYPAMIDGDEWVYGELITIEDYEKTVEEMDEMEHYYGKDNNQNEYNRVILEVELIGTSGKVKAYTYKYNEESEHELKNRHEEVSHGDWRKFMKDE
ncbi:gamma-glutamylcyclotransferase (GGCT)/AIG2-like uncharacterized protein YtfP [Clostridium pascui]|uniref:gamma-glutamylcyclotransferase family protein n=1 Tax=Clostridium pascui TaxID=46609 RepID=UPI001958F9A1|nr:gamma-glutamylcyclotransferase family protein [Clostridium pascui]MBM7870152.1 gamma-glutamylcyclotransferase (GGCT)/AIG2-like uncharacterized protein YtfP [Clostridium pascui]